MNARKAVLADNPELILRVLQLRFDESLSYPRISAQTGISKTAIFSLVRRFHQIFTDWPLSGEYSCVQLARALFPGRYPSAPTVTQTVKTEKNRRNRFSPEFKWRLVQQTLLPGACVAQIARENGINDNLLFNWRHLWRNGGLQPPGEHETSLLPVTLTPEPDNKIPDPVQVEQINTPTDSLCCELVLPAGTLRLSAPVI
ncbi:IS66-like element accessory protein TnpA [Escherichia coli]|uniref:IS66-like element accessory protein TnpA n=1 Tax=Escherichia coli TaxID=562 RepID=UPI003A8A7B89